MPTDIQDPKTAEIFEKAEANCVSIEEMIAGVDEAAAALANEATPMHDSGQRQEFSTGAVRDTAEDKPRLALVSPFAMRRLGEWLRLGACKYEDRNWEKGIPLSRCLDSLLRHATAFQAGETSEDHLAAVMCNAMFMMHTQEMIRRSVLPDTLDDMPEYGSR